MRLPPKLQNRSLRVTQGLNQFFRKLHFDSLQKRQNLGIWIEKDGQEEPSATQRLSPHSLRRVSPQTIRGPCCLALEEHARGRESGSYSNGRIASLSLLGGI